MQQKRLVLALLISTAVLFGWNYLFPIKAPQRPNPASISSPSPANSPSQSAPTPGIAPSPGGSPSATAETSRQRAIVVKTPLYEARFDTHGAVAVSWILKKSIENGKDLHSAGG